MRRGYQVTREEARAQHGALRGKAVVHLDSDKNHLEWRNQDPPRWFRHQLRFPEHLIFWSQVAISSALT
jgi:hypothetical protein